MRLPNWKCPTTVSKLDSVITTLVLEKELGSISHYLEADRSTLGQLFQRQLSQRSVSKLNYGELGCSNVKRISVG